jgi:hypothetical protein
MGIHACKDKRFVCTECHKTCSATTGTACSRLRTSAETVRLVGTLLAHGCPLHALVVAFGSDERTGAGGGHVAAPKDRRCRSISSSHRATWGRCKPMRSGSKNGCVPPFTHEAAQSFEGLAR